MKYTIRRLALFAALFSSLAVFVSSLTFYQLLYSLIVLVLATIFSMSLIVLIGVLELRQDDRLEDQSTVELIEIVFKKLPVIGGLIDKIKSE